MAVSIVPSRQTSINENKIFQVDGHCQPSVSDCDQPLSDFGLQNFGAPTGTSGESGLYQGGVHSPHTTKPVRQLHGTGELEPISCGRGWSRPDGPPPGGQPACQQAGCAQARAGVVEGKKFTTCQGRARLGRQLHAAYSPNVLFFRVGSGIMPRLRKGAPVPACARLHARAR